MSMYVRVKRQRQTMFLHCELISAALVHVQNISSSTNTTCQIHTLRSVARSFIPLSTQVSPLTLYCRWRGKSRPSLIARYKHDTWHAGACIHSILVESPAQSRLFSLPNGTFKSKLFPLAPSFPPLLVFSLPLTFWFDLLLSRIVKSQTEDQRLVGIEEKIVYDEGKVTTRKRTRRTHVYQHTYIQT